MTPLVRVSQSIAQPEMVNGVSVWMISPLAVRLPLSWMVLPEVKALANCTSLATGGRTSPAQLAMVDQLELAPPPSQIVVTAMARWASDAASAAEAHARIARRLLIEFLITVCSSFERRKIKPRPGE